MKNSGLKIESKAGSVIDPKYPAPLFMLVSTTSSRQLERVCEEG